MEMLLLGGCFVFVLAAVLCGGYWFLREPAPKDVDEGILSSGQTPAGDGPILQTLEKIGSILPPANDQEHPIRQRLAAAGYRDPDALQAFYGLKAVAAILAGGLLAAFSMRMGAELMTTLVVALAGAGAGFLLPERLLDRKRVQRKLRLRQGVPAAVDLLVLSIEAGQALDTAMLETSRELKRVYPELSEELALTHLESRAGQSRAEVLARLAQRTGEPEIKKLTNLLLDGERFGTALGPALRTHSQYTRLRRRQLAQEQARKTSVKLVFPVFFLIFPCVLLVTLGPAVLQLMQGMSQMLGSGNP